MPADVREAFGRAGYRADQKAHRLIAPGGRAVSAPEYERLLAPFDASKEHLPSMIWGDFIVRGYRLDEKTCRLVSPGEKEPLLELAVVIARKEYAALSTTMALERLVLRLRKLDPSQPLPLDVLNEIKVFGRTGMPLPPSLLRALKLRPGAGGLLDSTGKSYRAMQSAWEGERDRPGTVSVPLPPPPGLPARAYAAYAAAVLAGVAPRAPLPVPAVPELFPPRTYPARVASWERRLGDRISAKAQSLFRLTPSGRELLGRFRDTRGNLDLPPITILKYVQRPDDKGYGDSFAVYSSANRSIIFNHWALVNGVLLPLEPAKSRAALARELSNPERLARYLERNPAKLDELVGRVDDALYHELTHAWQDRRLRLMRESRRENAPGVTRRFEYEAFFGQFLYLHEKLALDPGRAVKSQYFNGYVEALKTPAAFQEKISNFYASHFLGSDDFPVLRETQAMRRSVASGRPARGFYDQMRRYLRNAGLNEGDAAMKEAEQDVDPRLKQYVQDVFPRLRKEAIKDYPERLKAAGRPDAALRLLVDLTGLSDANSAQRRAELATAAAAFLARPDNGLSASGRFDAEICVYGVHRAAGKPAPPGLPRLLARDGASEVDRILGIARRDPSIRAQALDSLYFHAEFLSSDDTRRVKIAGALEQNRPDRALDVLMGSKGATAERLAELARKSAAFLAGPGTRLPAQAKGRSYGALNAALRWEGKSFPPPPLRAAYARDAAAVVKQFVDKPESDRETRLRSLENVRSWAELMPADHPLRIRVAEAFDAARRPDRALLTIGPLPPESRTTAAAFRDRAARKAADFLLTAGPADDIHERMILQAAIEGESRRSGRPFPAKASREALRRDIRQFARFCLSQASRRPGERGELIADAGSWLHYLPANDPTRRLVAEAERGR